jgi:hypothetical protein
MNVAKWVLWIMGTLICISMGIHTYTVTRVDFLSNNVEQNYMKRIEVKDTFERIDKRLDRIDKKTDQLIEMQMRGDR